MGKGREERFFLKRIEESHLGRFGKKACHEEEEVVGVVYRDPCI